MSCVTPSGNVVRKLAGSAIAVRFILTAENRSQSRTGREAMAVCSGLGLSVSSAALLCLVQFELKCRDHTAVCKVLLSPLSILLPGLLVSSLGITS